MNENYYLGQGLIKYLNEAPIPKIGVCGSIKCPPDVWIQQCHDRRAAKARRVAAIAEAEELVRSHRMIQPEAPSPAPVPQSSVIYAEPIKNHNNREIIQLKEKIKSLEEENKSLKNKFHKIVEQVQDIGGTGERG